MGKEAKLPTPSTANAHEAFPRQVATAGDGCGMLALNQIGQLGELLQSVSV
jgi:hypothetical protein